jgi:hypothetical protein
MCRSGKIVAQCCGLAMFFTPQIRYSCVILSAGTGTALHRGSHMSNTQSGGASSTSSVFQFVARKSSARKFWAALLLALPLAGLTPGDASAQSFGGGTFSCSTANGVESCTVVGGAFNGLRVSFNSLTNSAQGTFGACTVTVPNVSNPAIFTASSGCSSADISAFAGLAASIPGSSTAINTASLGLVAQNVSQVSVTVVRGVITSIRDAIQRRGGGSSAALRYTWDPNADDDALSYGAKSPVSQAPVFKAMPKAPLLRTVTYGLWGQGFGDVEWRSGSIGFLDLGRTTTTVGGIAGADVTITNIFSATDAYVFGVLGGFTSAHVRNNDGSSARIDGPGVGLYSIYVNGGFSTDTTFKVDFFDLNRSAPFAPDLGLHLTNYTTATNVNYKFDTMPWWVEPTVGVSYTATIWDGGSKALGFEDGHTWRVQGGVRIGTTYDWNGVKVEPTLTGLAYSDVEIQGGTVAQAAGGLLVPTDQGKVFGQGIAKLNFLWTNNFSSYIETEVRGREGVLGAAGRAGLRYTFN